MAAVLPPYTVKAQAPRVGSWSAARTAQNMTCGARIKEEPRTFTHTDDRSAHTDDRRGCTLMMTDADAQPGHSHACHSQHVTSDGATRASRRVHTSHTSTSTTHFRCTHMPRTAPPPTLPVRPQGLGGPQ